MGGVLRQPPVLRMACLAVLDGISKASTEPLPKWPLRSFLFVLKFRFSSPMP